MEWTFDFPLLACHSSPPFRELKEKRRRERENESRREGEIEETLHHGCGTTDGLH